MLKSSFIAVPALFLALIFSIPVNAQWQTIEPGIDYREYTVSGPNNVFVTRMDRSDTSCIIDSCIAKGMFGSGFEMVSEMAERYEGTMGYWGQSWGPTYDVVAAINGDGFSYTTGVPTNGQIISGWYAKRFDNFTTPGFVWTLNRQVFMGGYITHPSAKNIIYYVATGQDQNLSGINRARGDNEIVIYTPHYGSNTKTDNSGSEVVVELPRPLLIMPTPSSVQGTVKEIRQNLGSTPIPFDCIVLSAKGSATAKLLANSIGNEVRISQELNHYEGDPGDYTKTYSCIGYMTFRFLKDGAIPSFTNPAAGNREPRTAVAYNADYIYFLVVDGRSTASVGMTMNELGNFCITELNATDGINQDGGGSSTLWLDGEIKNVPSNEQPARDVANGLLMIKVNSKKTSSQLPAGSDAHTRSSTVLRQGPGTNYAYVTSLSAGQTGVVIDHSLNGVWSTGNYWWKCDFGGTAGWIDSSSLQIVSSLSTEWGDYR